MSTKGYPIQIPDVFLETLSDSRCMRLVQEVMEEFSEFIARNEVVFFRDYTDHGPRHIKAVLETSFALMPKESWESVTPEDVCVLVVATMLHDSAMHLQEPSFIALVSDNSSILFPELDKSSWGKLWSDYVSEIGRMSQSQLKQTFGTADTIPAPDLDNPDSWTRLQYAFIGEFIRRYHHRLAHEIACNGLPGVNNGPNFPPRNDSDSTLPLVDLSGLVARSHGMAIRPLLPYLVDHYHKRTFDSSHPVYLMVLLRIADYLQLQSSRAPANVFKIKRIQSPQSQREWKVHESIKDILYGQNDDPESVEIIVDPSRTSINVFLRIQEWLQGIQTELDTSWAVLGEVFGRFDEKKLGLTIRRIRSNIDHSEKFGKDAGFVPKRISFSAADAELLKLLIKPLYGDRPEIAVRELVQNAVDAVRERRALCNDEEQTANPDVEVQVKKNDDGKWSLIVEDSGTGMTYDTLSNYFLNAGASFRSSMTWKKQFQADGGDSMVLRSGRFGVGALAAFLLADDPKMVKLKVSTRHVLSDEGDGLEFEAELTDQPLTVRHVNRSTPGTRIEVITASAPAFMQRTTSEDDSLVNEWDWYCLDSPRVRRVGTSGSELTQAIKLPASVETSPDEYHWIAPDGFQSVGWTYENAPALVCNGIIVTRGRDSNPALEESKSKFGETTINLPSLSVFDPNGKLPLTLDRLRLDFERISFLNDLREDVLRNIAAYLVVCAPSNLKESDSFDITKHKMLRTHPAIASSVNQVPWILTPQGVSIYAPELFSQYGVASIVELRETKDLDVLIKTAKNDQFGFAISDKPFWPEVKSKSKSKSKWRMVKGAKRGVFREISEFDTVDERRVEMALEVAENPRRAYRDDGARADDSMLRRMSASVGSWFGRRNESIEPHEFNHDFSEAVERITHLYAEQLDSQERGMLRELDSRVKREIEDTGTVSEQMMEAFLTLRFSSQRRSQRSVERQIHRAFKAYDTRNEIESAREMRYEFERRLHRINDRIGYSTRHDLEDTLRDVLRRLERQLEHSETVSPEMRVAYGMLDDINEEDDPRIIVDQISQVASVFDRQWAEQSRMSPDEARHRIERAHGRLESVGQVGSRIGDAMRRLHENIDRSENVPQAIVQAISVFETVTPRESIEFVTEGSVSSSVIAWDDVSRGEKKRNKWAITEYEIDSSYPVESASNTLARVWQEQIGTIVIPFDLEDRKAQLNQLWQRDDMKRHLHHWESELAKAQSSVE